MFQMNNASASILEKIVVGEGWNYTGPQSDNVFRNCVNLKGEKGTEYDISKINSTYARVDGGPTSATPGYFTKRVDPQPDPDPSPIVKDESCEKVIGPTWHWNNTKGIC